MARAACSSSDSDDEFPDLDVVVRRLRQKQPATTRTSSRVNKDLAPISGSAPAQAQLPPKPPGHAAASASDPKGPKGTQLRRRKLGSLQVPGATALFQKLNPADELKGDDGKAAPRSRTSRVRTREVREKPTGASDVVASATGTTMAVSRNASPSSPDEDDEPPRPLRGARRARARLPAETKTPQKASPGHDNISSDDDEPPRPLGGSRRTFQARRQAPLQVEESEDDEDSAPPKQQESDSDSEFVTALDLESASDSSYSDAESDPFTSSKRSRSPTGPPRFKNIHLPPVPEDAPRRNQQPENKVEVCKKPVKSPAKAQTRPQTPPERKPTGEQKRAKGNLDDELDKLRIYAAENDSPPAKPVLDPAAPGKRLLPSPVKAPRIPESPWKPEHKEFWDPEVQNKWIDQYSPAKTKRTKAVPDVDNIKTNLKTKYGTSPQKRDAKKAFDQTKDALAQRFLAELDEVVTHGKLAKLTAGTGGVGIRWSTTLQSTAGRAHWKCKEVVTMTQQPDGAFASVRERQHHAYMELATKVLTNEDDLLNTVAHEFCHLATFMLDGRPKFAHGAEFKAWGARCTDAFGARRGIVVTTKHDYDIDYKYVWRCADCSTEVRRHSKSVDPTRQYCGRCRGALVQVKPVPRGGGTGGGGGAGKKTAYQEFMAREMRLLKAEGRSLNFKDMMTTVATRWKEQQQQQQTQAKDGGSARDKDATKLREITREFEELAVADVAPA